MSQSDTEAATANTIRCLACLLPFGTGLVCAHCGTSPTNVPWEYPQLRPGSKIHGRYIIGRALGKGGFAITYLALQEGLNRRVAIKEYFPFDVAERAGNATAVHLRQNTGNTETTESYQRGVNRFLEEGQNIVQCHQPNPHPNLVRVTDYFEENGTAYLVMDYVEGISLENFLKSQPRSRLDERQARELIIPVLSGLSAVHKHGFLHRDVKPANIYISKQGTVILLDFGSARQALSNERHTLTVMLTPGYAPPEQYSGDGEQGPWTDVYGVAATLYRCVTGETPPSAMSRISSTDIVPPSALPEVRINGRIEKAIMAGLELDRNARIQNADDFQQALGGRRAEMLYEAVAMSGLLRNPQMLFRVGLTLVSVFVVVALVTTGARLIWDRLGSGEAVRQKATEDTKVSEQAQGLYQAGTMFLNAMASKVSGGDAKSAALNAGQAAMAARSSLDTNWVTRQGGETYKAAITLYTDGERALGEDKYEDARTAYESAADNFAEIILTDETASSQPLAAMAAIRERVGQQRMDIKGGKALSSAPAETSLAEQLFNQAAGESDPNKAVDLYRQASAIYSKLLPARNNAADALAKAEQRKKAEEAEKARKQSVVDPSIPVQEVDMGEEVTLPMVQVPAGEFVMGSPADEPMRQEDEGPQHRVVISRGFWMGRFEVTVAQFTRFTQQTGYRTTAEYAGGAWNITEALKQEWKKGLNWHKSEHNQLPAAPVVLVSWDDAQAFCRWLSEATGRTFRLPTEAEWEYACRAGSTAAYQWGGVVADGAGWLNGADVKLQSKYPQWRAFPFSDDSLYAAKVGSYRGNAWGLHDMHGNVWEWCQDWHSPEYYSTSPETDPFNGQMDRFHVVRSGSWLCYPGFCRSSVRRKYAPEYTTCDLGFRVVMSE
jgi:formylglycine-generating enzyme required for sulfatase activity